MIRCQAYCRIELNTWLDTPYRKYALQPRKNRFTRSSKTVKLGCLIRDVKSLILSGRVAPRPGTGSYRRNADRCLVSVSAGCGTQEIEALVDVDDRGFLLRQAEPDPGKNAGDLLPELLHVFPMTIYHHHEIIRIADNDEVGQSTAFSCRPCILRWLPRPLDMLVEHRQRDISQQRRQNTALRVPVTVPLT